MHRQCCRPVHCTKSCIYSQNVFLRMGELTPETCRVELKRLINEKVVASFGYLHRCTKMMHGHTNIKSYFTRGCKWISVRTSNFYCAAWVEVGTSSLQIMLLGISEFSKYLGREGRTFSYGRQWTEANACTVNNYPHYISKAMNALTNGCIPRHEVLSRKITWQTTDDRAELKRNMESVVFRDKKLPDHDS